MRSVSLQSMSPHQAGNWRSADFASGWLAEHGITSVTISGGYKAGMITEYVGSGARFGIRHVEYAIEDEPLGRGGGLKYAAGHLADPKAPFFVLNGDVITTFSLTALADEHDQRAGAVTVALSPYRSNWGVADLDDEGRIRGFVQSPELPYWITRAAMYAGCTPNLAGVVPGGRWEERRTQGVFTLPAHMAFFSGFLPVPPGPGRPGAAGPQGAAVGQAAVPLLGRHRYPHSSSRVPHRGVGGLVGEPVGGAVLCG
jgi:hypothetical protein